MKLILISLIILFPILTYSQSDTIKNKNPYIGSLSLSIKAGYHSKYLSYKGEYTGDGVIADAGASFELARNFFIGVNAEYWVSKFESEGPDNETYENTHTGWGIVFNMYYKILISKFSVDAGFGVGPYKIFYEHNRIKKYVDLRVFTQVDYKISKLFFITGDISYNLLYYNAVEGGRDFYNIKIGPTLILPVKTP
jgi:hypothetical protein